MGKVKEKRMSVMNLLIVLFSNMGMDCPTNIDEITDFVLDDINETAHPIEWHSGDVAIGFKRWVESKAKDDNIQDIAKSIIVIREIYEAQKQLNNALKGLNTLPLSEVTNLKDCTGVNVQEGDQIIGDKIVQVPTIFKMINWELLREQKQYLLNVISKDKGDTIDSLNGILSLIDAIQDYVVDEAKIVSSDTVFGKMDDEHFKIVHQGFNEDSQREEIQINIGEHGNLFLYKTDEGIVVDVYGQDDCIGTIGLMDDDFEPEKDDVLSQGDPIIGYQVVDKKTGEIHPDMDASFCVYSLSQANEMRKTGKNWEYLIVKEGDIEKPTTMFEGDPRK